MTGLIEDGMGVSPRVRSLHASPSMHVYHIAPDATSPLQLHTVPAW